MAASTHPRLPRATLTLALAVVAGTTAHSAILTGGFAGTGAGERIEQVAGFVAPVWREETGTRVEVSGTFVQHEIGEGSVFIRMLEEACPLALVWHGAAGFQLVPPGGLPENTPTTPTTSGPQTVRWRLRVHFLQRPAQRLILETFQEGRWQMVLDRKMEVELEKVREWLEAGGVLTVGIAGPVELGDDVSVKVARDGTLLLVY